jgi:Cu(I)/Ag(I) efflux system membrane fusion protein
LAQAGDLDSARAAFKPLSETLIKVLGDSSVKFGPYVEAYCPMVKAHWLQAGTTVSNPFGSSMARCGLLVGSNSATSTLPLRGGCCN